MGGRGVHRVAYRRNLAVGVRLAVAGPGHVINMLLRVALGVDPSLDDLHTVEVGTGRILGGVDQQPRRAIARRGGEIRAHGHALAVADGGNVVGAGVAIIEVEAGEHAQADARTGGAVHFLALEGGEDGLAGVLLCPHSGKPGGGHVPGREHQVFCLGGSTLTELGIGADLAEEVGLFHRRHADVAVGSANKAKLEGVLAEILLQGHAAQQPATGIVGGCWLHDLAGQQLVTNLVVGELVVGRELGMGFRGALVLGDLHEQLPAHTLAGVLSGQRPTLVVGVGEHQAAGNIGIVGNGNEVGASALVGVAQEGEQCFRVEAVLVAEGHEAGGLFNAIGITDHIAVQVLDTFLARNQRGPFPGKEGSELPRHVVAVGGVHLLTPASGTHGWGKYCFGQCCPVAVLGAVAHESTAHLGVTLQGLDHRATAFGGHQQGVGLYGHDIDTQVGGVIGDGKEIQGAVDLHLGVQVGMIDGNALGEAVGVVGPDALVAGGVGVRGEIGVQV